MPFRQMVTERMKPSFIDGVNDFPSNSLSVFTRWGTRVFYEEGYGNDWKGNWEGERLPQGTYFYVFEDGEGETFSGYVQINR